MVVLFNWYIVTFIYDTVNGTLQYQIHVTWEYMYNIYGTIHIKYGINKRCMVINVDVNIELYVK